MIFKGKYNFIKILLITLGALFVLALVYLLLTHKAAPKNALSKSLSPYLLLHKDNPVAWKEWSHSALEQAKDENKLIFISIGYSTCHWCHVMNKESFSNPEVALVLNNGYVSIKIDREERPDLDRMYMSLVEQLGYGGGWPLNVWLTPDGQPFYGSTYLSKKNLISVATKIKQSWSTEPLKIRQVAREVKAPKLLEGITFKDKKKLLLQFESGLIEREQSIESRRVNASRFPRSATLEALMLKSTLRPKTHNYLYKTLNTMSSRGLYDPVHGGFYRYTVDPEWKTPHFEKTLYDNAQLAKTYTEAYLKTKNPEYKHISQQTINFLNTHFKSPKGVFYAATDADSLDPATNKKKEGFFYGLNEAEVMALKVKFPAFNHSLSLHTPHGKKLTFLHKKSKGPLSRSLKIYLETLRGKKVSPNLDKKIITSWNALMITTLSRAYQVYGDDTYLNQAVSLAHALKDTNYINDQLYRYSIGGKPANPATVEDYAFLIQALLDLYSSDFNDSWLSLAFKLQKTLETTFWLPKKNLYLSPESLRYGKGTSDPSINQHIPPANVVCLENHQRLYGLTLNRKHLDRSQLILNQVGQLRAHILSYPSLMRVLDVYSKKMIELVIVGERNSPSVLKLLDNLYSTPQLPIITLLKTPQSKLALDGLKGKKRLNNKTTFYVCVKGTCLLPTTSFSKAQRLINALY